MSGSSSSSSEPPEPLPKRRRKVASGPPNPTLHQRIANASDGAAPLNPRVGLRFASPWREGEQQAPTHAIPDIRLAEPPQQLPAAALRRAKQPIPQPQRAGSSRLQPLLPDPRTIVTKKPQRPAYNPFKNLPRLDLSDDEDGEVRGFVRPKQRTVGRITPQRPKVQMHVRELENDYVITAADISDSDDEEAFANVKKNFVHDVARKTIRAKKVARAARKTYEELDDEHIGTDPKDSYESPSSSDEEMYHDSSNSQADEEMEVIDATTPHPSLLRAVEKLTLDAIRIQRSGRLPFLRRNLRQSLRTHGFHLLSRTQTARAPIVNVIYAYGPFKFMSKCKGWKCPLCELFGSMSFATKSGLEEHLWSNHTSCTVTWGSSEGEGETPTLEVSLPDEPESDSDSDEEEVQARPGQDERLTVVPMSIPTSPQLVRFQTPVREDKPFLRGPSVSRILFPSSPVKPQPFSPGGPISPFVPPSSPRTIRQEPQSPQVTPNRPPKPVDPDIPDRYPTPPPYDDLLGPSAVYPYIPDHMYSARPDGPKIYDLLNELPLEPYGIMKWAILDREDEIFELSDVLESDKVVQFLWCRWILLHRLEFVDNYYMGIKSFIDEYWLMIHRTAGFSALRVWLLMLVFNRYITGPAMCHLLKYYGELVGMNLWELAPMR